MSSNRKYVLLKSYRNMQMSQINSTFLQAENQKKISFRQSFQFGFVFCFQFDKIESFSDWFFFRLVFNIGPQMHAT